jgi:predicted RNase H-like HicB family nuclease
MNSQVEIFLTKTDDGSFLAASIDSPRFCVSAPTRAEAVQKAERARAYFLEASSEAAASVKPRSIRVISPVFVPEKVCA